MTIVAVELAQTASGVVHPLWLTSFSQKGDRLAIEGKTPLLCRVRRATHQ